MAELAIPRAVAGDAGDPATYERSEPDGTSAESSPATTGSVARSSGPTNRRTIWIATTAIVVVVVVLVAGLVTGVIPGLRSSSGPSHVGEQLTYNQSAPLAAAVAAALPEGPWTPIEDEGVDSEVALPWDFAVPCLLAGPSLEYLSAARPLIPAVNGSSTTGAYPYWSFLFFNGTADAQNHTYVLDVGVVNGSAIAIATFAAPCYLGTTGFTALPASASVDSPAAQATAMAANTTFFAAHPRLNVTAGLDYYSPEILSPAGWTWTFEFTTCPLVNILTQNTTAYPGVSYQVLVNETSGAADPAQAPPRNVTCYGLPADG